MTRSRTWCGVGSALAAVALVVLSAASAAADPVGNDTPTVKDKTTTTTKPQKTVTNSDGSRSAALPEKWIERKYLPCTKPAEGGGFDCSATSWVAACGTIPGDKPGSKSYWMLTRTVYRDGAKPTAWSYEDNGAGRVCRTPGQPLLTVDPEILARMVFATMHFHNPQIGMVPRPDAGHQGYLGLPAWMWVSNPGPGTTQNQDVDKQAMGLEVSISATYNGTHWDMGDGHTVTCPGAGTPYQDSDGTRSSPDCGYRYPTTGSYTVTATPDWTITWQVARTGATGNFDAPVEPAHTQVRIGELQVLND